MEYLEALKARRSEYDLSKDISMSMVDLENYLKDIMVHTPSAFNSESQRILLLLNKNHDLFWDELIMVMKGIVEGKAFEKTKSKLEAFKRAYGTILFFDDMSVIEQLQNRFPLYKENFSQWSIEQNAMLQSNIWVGLKTHNIGASLQHYNELMDAYVKKTFNIPKEWELRSQMPFGHIVEKAEIKEHSDISKRFLIMF